uniref:Uncharacterized protein n=1 Tax=viral metagenome TaxID=1070528 RepID=A0A6M3Y0A5_9ZZZZ
MKLHGSAIICIECLECHKTSPKFRVYLYEEEGEDLWETKQEPEGWGTPEGAELVGLEDRGTGDMVLGYCPEHKGGDMSDLIKEIKDIIWDCTDASAYGSDFDEAAAEILALISEHNRQQMVEMPEVENPYASTIYYYDGAGHKSGGPNPLHETFKEGAQAMQEALAKLGCRPPKTKAECEQFVAYISQKLAGGEGDWLTTSEQEWLVEETRRWLKEEDMDSARQTAPQGKGKEAGE